MRKRRGQIEIVLMFLVMILFLSAWIYQLGVEKKRIGRMIITFRSKAETQLDTDIHALMNYNICDSGKEAIPIGEIAGYWTGQSTASVGGEAIDLSSCAGSALDKMKSLSGREYRFEIQKGGNPTVIYETAENSGKLERVQEEIVPAMAGEEGTVMVRLATWSE